MPGGWVQTAIMELEPTHVADAMNGNSARFLGSGTFGWTWLVEGIGEGGNRHAVKILKPERFNRARVLREIQGMQRFDHPGIARLDEVRQIQIEGRELLALVCDYIPGWSVEAAARSGQLPNNQEIRAFASALLRAVSALHEANTVHRDIKPDNIMLRDHDWSQPVLIDFGLSKAVSDLTVTQYPGRVGSPPWMAPEQLGGERARKASDMWACGVVLFQLLEGTHPYIDLSDPSLDIEDLYDMATAPHRPWTIAKPKKLVRLVNRLLTPDPLHARGSAKRALKDIE